MTDEELTNELMKRISARTSMVEAAMILTILQQTQECSVPQPKVTCPCGKQAFISRMYKCLYCSVIYCKECAVQHFGETIEDFTRREQQNTGE